jgi:hypothetical protein
MPESNERDPRKDPRPGDGIKSKSGAIRQVKASNEMSVWYEIDVHGLRCDFGCLLEEWRIEAENAEVLHVAE